MLKMTLKLLELVTSLVCGCFYTFPLLLSTFSDISEMHIKKSSSVCFFFFRKKGRKEENEFPVFTLNGKDSFIYVLNISEVIIVK